MDGFGTLGCVCELAWFTVLGFRDACFSLGACSAVPEKTRMGLVGAHAWLLTDYLPMQDGRTLVISGLTSLAPRSKPSGAATPKDKMSKGRGRSYDSLL